MSGSTSSAKEFKRKSGILLHISSLPSPHGIGTLGQSAFDFIDFLRDAGQSYWQILPLGPTSFGDSPYQSFSSYAGNPYLIDLDQLIELSLLDRQFVAQQKFSVSPERVNYALLWQNRHKVLYRAWQNFCQNDYHNLKREAKIFYEEQSDWLNDYALFMAIKSEQPHLSWHQWPRELKRRKETALEKFSHEHSAEIDYIKFIQFLFFRQWHKVKDYAHSQGIEIIGDLPIYVADDSVEFWLSPELFIADENLDASLLAGCPPDAFNAEGQLWGNPLYNWSQHEKDDFSWWLSRLEHQLKLYDILRLDHFRGFEAYWAVNKEESTAKNGCWYAGPAEKFFDIIFQDLNKEKIFIEDLGFITASVEALRDKYNLPTMRVLQFALTADDLNEHIPHNLPKNCILYTGTHDNKPLASVLSNLQAQDFAFAKKYFGLNEEEGYVKGLIRAAATAVSHTVIYQLQDLLALGEESRMNLPGSREGNWQWRLKPGQLTDDLAAEIFDITKISGRLR